MKKLITILVVLLPYFVSAQEVHKCGVTHEWTAKQLKKVGKTSIFNAANANPSTSNVQFIPLSVWLVKHTDGSASKHANFDVFYHSLMQTNKVFSSIGVQFYIHKTTEIHDDNLLTIDISNATALFSAYDSGTDATDVYLLDGFTGFQASGYGSPDAVYLSDATEGTAPHEFGHYLTLAHTFDTGKGAELVDGSNCQTAGDEICDTPADPNPNDQADVDNCIYIGNATDANGQAYNPPLDNIMSYWGGMCGFKFTAGQYAKMVDGYNTHHTAYTAAGEIANAPSNVSISNMQGYDLIQWTNASNSKGTQIEYSSDGGTNWHVMNGVLASSSNYAISNTLAGTAYKLRLRHLNSTVYTEINYNPTISSPQVPVVAQSNLYAITHVKLNGTSIDNTTTGNEVYTLNTPSGSVDLFKGGTYSITINPDNYVGRMSIYLDENGDGDFDDAGELKYSAPDNGSHWSVSTNISIDANTSTGYKRLRIRSNSSQNAHDPYKFYTWSETEDYIVKVIDESAPSNLSASYDSGNQHVNLTWSDTFDSYKYVIERSTDGLNFQQVAITSDGVTKSFDDSTAPPNHQLEYRIKREGGALYSDSSIAYTEDHTISYCVPISVNACGSNYGISNFKITSLSFENNTSAGCGVTSAGYSDYYNTHNLNFTAGTTYTAEIENSAFNYSKYVAIYIDFNQNGQFDSYERVAYNNSNTNPVYSASIAIPSDAVNGETRMRVRSYYNDITDACSQGNFGETEDYKVTITGGREHDVINARAQNPTATSIDLIWDIGANASPTGFEIKKSVDGTNFTAMTSLASSDRSYTVSSLTTNTKYWFQIIETGSINSNPMVVWNTTLSNLDNDNFEIERQFNLYPMPYSKGILNIKTSAKINAIELFDLNGKMIFNLYYPKANQGVYSIENIPSGTHLIRIKSNIGDISRVIKSE